MEYRRLSPNANFVDLVLSWSPQDIVDHDLYKNQVDKIPLSFESMDQYLASYTYPLLEETRAELASAIEAVYKLPFAEITSFKEHNKLLYYVKVDHWENIHSDRGREAYSVLPGDIVLISNMKPETAFNIRHAGYVFFLACVKNTVENRSCVFRIRTSQHIEVADGERKSLYVVCLMNMNRHERIWNALGMRRSTKIIEKVLTKNDLGLENCEFCRLKCKSELEENFGSGLSSKLNESQLQAVLSSLSKIKCTHKFSVDLIWGPPGTGKTTTLSIFLHILSRMNVRTVICAPTDAEITELASRVIKLVRSSFKTESGDSSLPCSLGDMLIYVNKDSLKVGPDIEDIFLDDRVEHLENCLAPLKGWRCCVLAMLGFLEGCVSQHKVFVNEISKGKSLLEFARDRFSCLATPLRKCILKFVTHLPRSFVHQQSLQSMEQLMCHLDSIEMSLFEDNSMTSEKLESIFGSEPFVDTLLCIKNECAANLRSLLSYSEKLDLPIGASTSTITEFCFRNASLIFCTISSSYKLHSVITEPITVLVIDKAARVKECETIIPLNILDVRHAVLVGDERQLPATVNSKMSEKAGFGRSLFERLSLLGHSKHLLNVQYKMHPSISQFPNLNFYQNQILDAPCVQSQSYEKCYLEGRMFGPYSFINIRGGKEEFDDVGKSISNMVEVAVIMKVLQKLFKAWNGMNENLSIGLISPYAAQVQAIQDKIQHKYEHLHGFTVEVSLVNEFQNGEKDIIIISTVRSHNCESVGFSLGSQGTNFALTRARHSLWIVGDEKALSVSDSVWEALILDAKHRQCFFSADEDYEISKTIVNVKKEMKELEGLFGGESVLFNNSRWKVHFSDSFLKSFMRLKSASTKRLVIGMLLKLASGWRPKKVNVDLVCKGSSYIVKQFKINRYYIVCSVDINEDSVYEQVLKVWDLLSHMDGTRALLRRLDNLTSMYTDDFIRHCNEKLLEGNLEVPKSWPLSEAIIKFKNRASSNGTVNCASPIEKSKVSESLLLMKFYSLSTGTVNYLLTDLEGRELDLPFEVTHEERMIIMFPKSSFILGRSGTGKTTILTMKLFRNFQQYRIASQESTVSDDNSAQTSATTLRQLFVTVSPKLCYAVKKHVSQLKSYASGNFFGNSNFLDVDDIDDMAEFKDIPDTFVGIQPDKYPLIITFHKFLMMLDGTLGNSYFDRLRNVQGSHRSERLVALKTFIRKKEVTYGRFQSIYWPHFNVKLTKNLDPSRVFTEIISHIKGGTTDSQISRQEYISLSRRRVSTLSADNRGVIYDIFHDYEKMKLNRQEFDLADFVIDIHLRLKNVNLMGDKMDFVYIDEVQDLTMRQISLFRCICKNVDEGFVFSGDTAQTIARGIDFRFEDIRSLFYKYFVMKSRNCKFQGRGIKKGLISDTFCLSQNFRTHTGVLKLAQSVIDLISHFFPQSIDSLAPETSLTYGEPPLILEPSSDENLIVTIFGNTGNAGRKWVGFGADQVILVRDDSVRQEISGYVGHQAFVMTIVECKGLEFQDVLLYNFIGSSPLSSEWRLLYEFMGEKGLLGANSAKSSPNFGQPKHNILCSELKQLYVAITRTRQRLWIYENNEVLSKPILDYWKSLSVVEVRKFDDSFANELQRVSSHEEWKSQGIKLFFEENYAMATMCFDRAGDETWGKRAKASGLRVKSDCLRGSNPEGARIMLREAAELFDSIDRLGSAAQCFCELGEYERAGRIYMKKSGASESELRKAGECFSLAGHHKTAAEVYAKGHFFKECLSSCARGKYFGRGLQYIEDWNSETVDKFALEFLKKCPLECFRTKDNASLMRLVRSLHTIDSKRNFLKSLNRLDLLLNLEEKSGNLNEAAEIAEHLGDIMCAVDLLEKSEQFIKASSLALSNVLFNSLWVSGTQGWPLKTFPQKDELLTKAMSASRKVSGTFHTSICTEAKILSHEGTVLSELAKCYNDSKRYKNCTAEILSVRKLLDAHFEVGPAGYEWDPELRIDQGLFDERISSNRVSGGTLLYVWNLWKGHSLVILDYVNSLESVGRRARCTEKDIVQFCLNYLGVRVQRNLDIVSYLLLKPNASWVRESVGERSSVVAIEASRFALAARNYWRQELVSVGFRVLEAFRALHEFSVAKMPLSMYYCQGLCLTSVYVVTRFFIELDSLDMNKSDRGKLRDFLQLSTTKYIDLVFPLDSRQSLSENLISLRETETSSDLLGEIFSNQIKIGHRLTNLEIGRVVIILLGSGKQKFDLYLRIAKRFNECSSSLRLFIRNFNSVQVDLGHQLHQALAKTYDNVDWRGKRDYISPNCFFYLVERLLILVPYSQGFYFATKSSFVEYLISLASDADPSAHYVTYEKSNAERIFDFVDSVVQQCLFSIHDLAEWINNSGIDCEYYFPVLMLRLVMILCLSCLNSKLSFNIILKLLGIPQIRSQLPREFCQSLLRKRANDDSSDIVAVIARAFEVIGDPLVIVFSSETRPKFSCPPDAVFVDLKSLSCRNEILKALFSSNTSDRKRTESSEIGVPPVVSDRQVNLDVNWGLIHEISESFALLRNQNDGNFKNLVSKKKEEMEKYLRFLTAVTTQLTEQRYFYGEDKNELFEAACMIEELNRLFSSSEMSEFDSEVISDIGLLLKDLEAKRVELDRLVSMFSMQTDPNGSVVVSPVVNGVRRKSEELLASPPANNTNQVAECSKGKGKSKKNNSKSRKGKKGGRRK